MTTSAVTATAAIAALSDRLLTAADVERMLSASDLTAAFAVLYDLRWASDAAQKDADHFEEVIAQVLQENKALLQKISPAPALTQLMLLPFDLQNAKVALAAHQHEQSYDDVREQLSTLGQFPRSAAFASAPSAPFLGQAMAAAKQQLSNNGDTVAAMQSLDSAFFAQLTATVATLNSPMLSQYLTNLIGAENCKRRVRAAGKATSYIASTDWAQAAATISRSCVSEMLAEGEALPTTELADWETRLELTVLRELTLASQSAPFDLAHLLTFWLTKLRNAEVIRTVLVGKTAGLDTAVIRTMLAAFLPFLPTKK